jgi:hypothetical protein
LAPDCLSLVLPEDASQPGQVCGADLLPPLGFAADRANYSRSAFVAATSSVVRGFSTIKVPKQDSALQDGPAHDRGDTP